VTRDIVNKKTPALGRQIVLDCNSQQVICSQLAANYKE
jgi:hypothetical protein